MSREKNAPSNYAETGLRQRFFLGDSESESDSDNDEPKRRFSMSDSESDDANSIIGGPPSAFNFVIDDDSGLGMSADGSSPEAVESNSVTSNDSQILPLRPMNIGNHFPKYESKPHTTRRSKKHHFKDFYVMKDDHLGAGAYASVCTCVSLTSGKEFAVKLVNKHEPGHTRSRILREVDIFKMCRGHPNFVQLIEWFEDSDYFYMVFEKMYGGPLLSHIQRKVCFTEQEAAKVTKDIATALKFLHSRGIAHRDLKPENVLCTEVDRVSPVKLCDLDLASKPSVHNGGLRRASRQLHNVQSEPDLASPVGSAEFMAPEVVEIFVGESLKYDRRCDLWSLGVIVFIMLCGYVPFYGECAREDCEWNQGKPCDDCQENLFEKIQQGSFEFPDEEWQNISVEAKDLISHLLVKNVRQRYTADDVLKHPWISHAPETPLATANNLYRNNSSKDIQQLNDHFNAINHFATRLSARVEETIPSVGSTPEDESPLEEAFRTDQVEKVLDGAKSLLENNANSEVDSVSSEESENSSNDFPQQYVDNQQLPTNMFPPNEFQPMQYYPPPIINMNGTLIYAPPMAPTTQQMAYIQHPMPLYYQQQQQMNVPFSHADPHYLTNGYSNDFQRQQNYMTPQQFYDPNPARNYKPREHFNTGKVAFMRRNRSNPLGNMSGKQQSGKIRQQASLSSSISKLALETCQNSIIRQNSAGKEIHTGQQSREAQVNV